MKVTIFPDFDIKPLMLANEYLDATLEHLGSGPHQRLRFLKDFRKRCKSKERRHSVIRTAKSFERAIKKAAIKIINYT